MLRIVLADDDQSFRRLVRTLFAGEEGFEVVGEAGDGREVVRLAGELQPDCVILDMKMPVLDGDAALAQIREQCPHTDVIALSGLEWVTRIGPAPDAALVKGSDAWMEVLPVLVETLALNRRLERPAAKLGR